MKQLFKISVKFEEDGKWSEREADNEGFLLQDDGDVTGYVKAKYSTISPVRYIKGLYLSEKKSLVFLQLMNRPFAPICYCFPNVEKDGFWSGYNSKLGFFPFYPGLACSQGHAKINMIEIQNSEFAEETKAIYDANVSDARLGNQYLMREAPQLTDFLKENIVLQMKLHCGKW